jgi:putative acetyltransferase
LELRPYRPGDARALLDLFRDTVRRVNARDYGPDQVRAWASDDIDPARWSARFEGRFVRVAESDGRLAGFAELEPDGHLDRFYVSADHQRRGVGRALLAALVAEAGRLGLPRLFTEASLTARPFFEAHGFVVEAPQTVVVRGVAFSNYRMSRPLDPPDVEPAPPASPRGPVDPPSSDQELPEALARGPA